MSFIPFVPGQILTAAELNAALAATIGPYLPLVGGEVTGGTLFSGAGTGLAVTNNATIGGTLGVTGATNLAALAATGAITGAGFTARFASPGPIGNTTPSTLAATIGVFTGAVTVTNAGSNGFVISNTGANGTTGYAQGVIKTTGVGGGSLGPALQLDGTSFGGHRVLLVSGGPGDGGGLGNGLFGIIDTTVGTLLRWDSVQNATFIGPVVAGRTTSQTISATAPVPAFVGRNTFTGTPPAGGTIQLGGAIVTTDTLNMANISGVTAEGFAVAMFTGGAAMTGRRVAIEGRVSQTSATLNAANLIMVGMETAVQASFNAGGTSLANTAGTRGQVYGMNPVGFANNTATFLYLVNGMEVNYGIWDSATAGKKIGLAIINFDVDTTAGALVDAAIVIGTQRPGGAVNTIPPVGFGIAWGGPDGQWPHNATSTLLGTYTQTVANLGGAGILPMIAGWGIDWSAVTFTHFSLLLPGFSVDGSGNTVISGYVANSVGNALTAVGTNRATSLALTKQVNNVTSAAGGTGVTLPSVTAAGIGSEITIFNAGANLIQVYGAGSDTIDGVAAATGVPLTNTKRCLYRAVAAATWVSAQLGVISA